MVKNNSQYQKEYYLNNIEKIKEKRTQYQKKNSLKINKRNRDWYSKNKNKVQANRRVKYFLNTYGLTEENYNKLVANRICNICGKKLVRPHIDHNHKTGKVRGVLCFSCNAGIGHLQESVEILHKAVEYLSRQ